MKIKLFLFALFVLCSLLADLNAQPYQFQRLAPGGLFRVPSFWTPFDPVNFPPVLGPGGENDIVRFNLGRTPATRYTIANVNGVTELLIIENDSLALQFNGYETVGDNFNASIIVGFFVGDEADFIFTGSSGPDLTSINTEISRNSSSIGKITAQGSDFFWDSGNINVGLRGSGTLAIKDGAVVSDTSATIANLDNSIGTATVDGNSSLWFHSEELTVGGLGDGSLNVSNGGEVSNTSAFIGRFQNSNGNVTVTGDDSLWTTDETLRVGNEGSSTLNIQNGGTVLCNNMLVAVKQDSTGEVTINGPGSTFQSTSVVHFGLRGSGLLSIENGGSFICNTIMTLGFSTNSSTLATIDGAGSTLTNANGIIVGNGGFGCLLIENSAMVHASRLSIGANVLNGTGFVSVQNGGILNVDAILGVGYNVDGDLTVQDGGLVFSDSGRVPESSSGNGCGLVLVTGENSVWEIFSQLSIFEKGQVMIQDGGCISVADETSLFSDGELNLEGGTFSSDTILFEGGGEFNWTGGMLHVRTFSGDLANAGGTLSPGQSAGSTTIHGNYTQSQDATLEIEIGGPSVSTEYDFVEVTGDVFLNGALNLVLIDGFEPTAEQTFTVLNIGTGSLFGFFANVGDNQRLDTVDGAGSFLVRYGSLSPNPNQIVLSDFQTTCTGLENGVLTVSGTIDDDLIDVTADSDMITVTVNDCTEIFTKVTSVVVNGLAGNDQITVNVPEAEVHGGPGNDQITANGPGGNVLFGEDGNDTITGGPGGDFIEGGLGMDQIAGLGGPDTIFGNSESALNRGNDLETDDNMLSGGDGNDLIYGTPMVDMIDGGRGSDEIYGFSGDDIIECFHGNDFVDAGSGNDTVRAGPGNDEVLGGNGIDLIYGHNGVDRLLGGAGDDIIVGGGNNDTIYGQNGDDMLFGNQGFDTIFGGNGDDDIRGGSGSDMLRGNSGNDSLFGSSGNDSFHGGGGSDFFTGGSGTDTGIDTGEAGEVSIEN